MDDDILLMKIKNDDEDAFKEIYNRYSRKIYYFSLKCLENHDEAEDIVQSVFIGLWENRSSLYLFGSVKNYLYKSAINRIINYVRKKNIQLKYIETHIHENFKESDLTYEQIFFNDLERVIQSIVKTLPPQQQKIFYMSRNEGMSYSDIATKLSLSIRTVENQIYRAMNTIKSVLKRKYFGY